MNKIVKNFMCDCGLRAPLVAEKLKIFNGVLRLINGEVATRLCLEDTIWPPLPYKWVAQWWGRPATTLH